MPEMIWTVADGLHIATRSELLAEIRRVQARIDQLPRIRGRHERSRLTRKRDRLLGYLRAEDYDPDPEPEPPTPTPWWLV